MRLEATARDKRIARSPEETGRTVSEISAALQSLAPCRLNDENSRAKFQNVRGDSSAGPEVGGLHHRYERQAA